MVASRNSGGIGDGRECRYDIGELRAPDNGHDLRSSLRDSRQKRNRDEPERDARYRDRNVRMAGERPRQYERDVSERQTGLQSSIRIEMIGAFASGELWPDRNKTPFTHCPSSTRRTASLTPG